MSELEQLVNKKIYLHTSTISLRGTLLAPQETHSENQYWLQVGDQKIAINGELKVMDHTYEKSGIAGMIFVSADEVKQDV